MPDLPTTARGAATSRRILDTAVREFADRGIAGARIDRIVAAARTNKAQLYGYYGSKEGLFDAVLADCLRSTRDEMPFDARDLAGWAVRVYDETLRNPTLVRLLGWIRLEQRPAGLVLGDFDTEGKLTAVAEAQAAGHLRAGDPADILIMVLSMASSWSPATGIYAASTDEPAAVHDRRRAFLRESVNRAVAP
ncbi:TetR family transcriptional regulator [Actinoplanes sp. NBRC 103695]|uniref:TetR/AcrR family transcriptional regulator n=1 Tax=Actinoplanes sp. NBRC 103695 TaxID=3032202 RepID=UPI0024A1D119|nr:TetR family transcriptional regulator [Actinoplanes sp. NBRC 103695]GLY95072.1 TetR family transcriptional regulator [Actinoplanes sp. NBRC 103695]